MPEINLTTLQVTYMYSVYKSADYLLTDYSTFSFAFFFLDSKLLGYAALNLDHKLPVMQSSI